MYEDRHNILDHIIRLNMVIWAKLQYKYPVIFKEPCPPCKQYDRPRMRSNRAQLLVTTLPAGK